ITHVRTACATRKAIAMVRTNSTTWRVTPCFAGAGAGGGVGLLGTMLVSGLSLTRPPCRFHVPHVQRRACLRSFRPTRRPEGPADGRRCARPPGPDAKVRYGRERRTAAPRALPSRGTRPGACSEDTREVLS